MWTLIDYKTNYYDNGCDVQAEERYLLRNEQNQETKWVSEFDYNKMKRLDLIQ